MIRQLQQHWTNWPVAAKVRLLNRLRSQTIKDEDVDLSSFADTCVSHYVPLAPSQMHEWLVGFLQEMHRSRGQKTVVIAPRGGAKTTWVSKIYPLACTLYGIEPYIMLISDTKDQSQQNLASIKFELEGNAQIARDFPWASGVGPEWSVDSILTNNGIRIEALGTGSRIRGRTNKQDRPTLIIMDDIENDESVISPTQRVNTMNWINRALVPVGTKRTNIFAVGTALHRSDALQTLKKTPGWNVQTFRSIIQYPKCMRPGSGRFNRWKEWTRIFSDSLVEERDREVQALAYYKKHKKEMDDGAVCIWPEMEDLYELMKLRATIGEAAFEAEKQGSPTSMKMVEWGDELFNDSIWFDKWPQTKLRVMCIDPSKGKSDKSDFTATIMLGMGMDGLLYVDCRMERIDVSQIVTVTYDVASVFMPDAIAFEINQFQELLQQEFEIKARKEGNPLSIFGVNNTLNKNVRIRKISPFLKNGRLKFKSNSRGAEMLVDQLREFPSAEHDDGPDALEGALRLGQWLLNPQQNPDDPGSPVTSVIGS